MNKAVPIVGGVIAVVIGLGFWLYATREEPEPIADDTPPAAAPPGEAAAIRNPIEPAADAIPLPVLDESDQPLVDALLGFLDPQAVKQFLIPKNLIRNIVATVDNLPRRKLALQQRPVTPIPGQPATTGSGEVLTLSGDNFARYDAFVALVERADGQQLAMLYRRYYPLFQEAYEGLGYPSMYFNDRLVEVIDHLLATPELSEPLQVTRPTVMYQFADPALEALSVGQKTLLRMGNEHATVVKTKLRDFRQEVAHQRPG